ncbi:MAG TPA: HupE/UreJ family protein [Myxococcales bacterium]|jgi:hypothetical protein|nr:HupE/UreJ family protein [Myxococcales bacterium]
MRLRRASCCALLGALFPLLAAAHDADLIAVSVAAPRPEVEERVVMTGGTLCMLVPVDADGDGLISPEELAAKAAALEVGVWDQLPLSAGAGEARCRRRATAAELREGVVELRASFTCSPGELRQRFRVLEVLPSNYRVVVARSDAPATPQRFAQGHDETVVIPEATSGPERISGLPGWIRLGVVHIFTGYDHLAFLCALLLFGKTWRRVLVMVTSFTVAHSITLAISALELVPLGASGSRLAEAAIAASVVYVAAENLVRRDHAHRAWLTFGFGLVHGFGFASALKGYGLGQAVVAGLLGFNLGVELGQACVVLALFPLVQLASRRPAAFLWIARAASAAIAAIGGYWLVDRLMALR